MRSVQEVQLAYGNNRRWIVVMSLLCFFVTGFSMPAWSSPSYTEVCHSESDTPINGKESIDLSNDLSLSTVACTIGNVVNVDCNGNETGSFIATGSGGSGNYSYALAGMAPVMLPPCSNLAPTFFNEFQFAWGFSLLNSSPVPITQWEVVIPNANYTIDPATVTNNSDFTYTEIDNGDGTYDLILTSTGGVNPFGTTSSYQINGINFGFDPSSDGIMVNCTDQPIAATGNTDGVFDNLEAGTYTVVVTDDTNGCTSECSVTITEPDVLSCIALSSAVMDCGDNDGTITVSATGGTPAYSYNAGNGTVVGNVISNLSPGGYTVTVTDANGCSTTCVANVMGLVTPSCSISNVVNVDCPGNSNGSFLATGMGGNSSIYSFTDGTTTNTDGVFTMLAAGTYMVTISEVANPSCSSVCTVQLTEPQFSCTTAVNSNVSCNGLADGSATVIPLGGTMPYTYAWDNGEMFSTAILLDAGTHIISVTDANGCITTCTVLITENPVLSCSVTTNSNSSCNGAADGILTTTAVGGAGAYEYSIDGVVFQASGIFSGLTAGTYTLTTRDGNGCLTTCIGVITEPAILSCSTVSTLESDCGANDGTITVAPTGGTAGYTFDAGAGVVTSNIITLSLIHI